MWASFCRASLVASLAAAACGETRPGPVERPAPTAAPAGSTAAPSPSLAADAGTQPTNAAASVSPPAFTARPDACAPGDCPDGMARIGRFCIDRHEAHLVTRGPSGEITAHPYHQRPEEGVAYEARSAAGVFPQAYISRVESQAACLRAGKRLCSKLEWQRACQGSRGTRYPYADRWQPKRCNMDKPHLLTVLFGADARRWRYEHFNDPRLCQEPGFLARSGVYDECVGDAGVYDLVGNLHEWVSDTVDAALMSRLSTEDGTSSYQPWSLGNGVFMGGFFSTHEEHGPGCRFTTVAHEPGYHDYSTGFRCCADAPPPPAAAAPE